MTNRKGRILASKTWWASTVAFFLIGVIVAVGGVIIEFVVRDAVGLIMIVLSTLWLAGAGVCATLGAKHESEELKAQDEAKKVQESRA